MLVDANIFLEVELSRKRSKECEEFLREVDEGKLRVFTTDFIIDSVIIIMENYGCKPEKIRRFLLALLISKGLRIYSHDFMDRLKATKNMKKFKLDFDDSLAIVAMQTLNLKRIVSFDKDFDRVKGIKRLIPSQIK